jgi:hypothetical protein
MRVLHAAVFAYSKPFAILAQLLQTDLFAFAAFEAFSRRFMHRGEGAMPLGVFLFFLGTVLGLRKHGPAQSHSQNDRK